MTLSRVKLWNIFTAIPLVLILIESFTYQGFLSKHFFLPPLLVILLCILGGLAVLATQRFLIALSQVMLLFGGYVFTSFLTIFLYWLEESHFPNYVFALLHINLETIRWLPVYLGLMLLLSVIGQVSKQKVFLFPLLVMLAVIVSRFAFPDTFLLIGEGGGLIRILKTIVLVSSFISVLLLLWRRKQFMIDPVSLFLIIAMGVFVFFLVGEELAWGQRLFHFHSSSFFTQNNIQHETTLHNLRPIQDGFLFKIYIIVGALGSFGWLLITPLTRLKGRVFRSLSAFIPRFWSSSFYYPLFIYGLLRVFTGPLKIKTWEESSELLFYVGVLIVTVTLWQVGKKKKTLLTWE